MSPEPLHLLGCAPVPLAHYLKALGVLRLVAEQADPGARGAWQGEHFVLHSRLDRDGLLDFFLRRYRPTPIVAPWNGGSGFYPKDKKEGIEALEAAGAARFAKFRAVIRFCRDLLEALDLKESPKQEQKQALILRVRAAAPDGYLAWLDAALLLTTDELRFPPLLGTGGNDGRLDFTNNFMQRLAELFAPASGEPSPSAGPLLCAALHGNPVRDLAEAAIGQFAPGAAGGPNATAGFEANSLINAWDFILMMEGALPFAAAATRRLGSGAEAALSYPFTVQPTGGGSGAVALADERPTRAEMWLPLWSRPSSCAEIRVLLAEGRATLGRRPARDGLDFARAVAHLGIDRGIHAFQRYAFHQRAGRAFIATPLGRIAVCRNPKADLIDQLERADWLGRFRRFARRDGTPARLGAFARRLDDALFDLASNGAAPRVQAVLIALGDTVAHMARSLAARETLAPPPTLDRNWIGAADDGDAEFRIAAALASLGWDRPGGYGGADEPAAADNAEDDEPDEPDEPDEGGDDAPAEAEQERAPRLRLPFCVHLAALDQERVFRPRRRWNRERASGVADGSALVVWGGGDLVANLIAVLDRRLLEAGRHGLDDKPLGGRLGVDVATIEAFLAGPPTFDDQRCAALLAGLAWAAPPHSLDSRKRPRRELPGVPFAYAALKPIFTPDAELRGPHPDDRRARAAQWHGVLPENGRLPVPPSLPRLLAAGRIDEALRLGLARARASGLRVTFGHRMPAEGRHWFTAPGARRLAAAMLIPIEPAALATLVERAYPVKDDDGDRNVA